MARSSALIVVDMVLVYGLPAWVVTRWWPRIDPAIRSAVGGGTVGEVAAFLALLVAIAAAVALARWLWGALTGRRP